MAVKIEYEAVVVQPAVDALTRALLEATPAHWQAVQLVLSFGGSPPVVTSPEGHGEHVAVTARIGLALAMLDRLRVDRATGWSGGVLVVKRATGVDGAASWQASLDWHYGGLANDAPAPRSSSVTGAMPAVSGDGAARYEALVARAESELAGGDPLDALATLGEALVALPGDTFERSEAGWIFVRMSGIRLAIGDARGAVRNAQSALRCAGWGHDARALLRLGQAQQLVGDDAAGATLVAAYRAGGDTWFASVAPELLSWARGASQSYA
ncbi:MAG TPA: hypothetical protein VM261_04680 [Kofleriaceae bacterium]|nr:hypothetical protein [Kofleriaceae bacterium]